MGSIQVELTRRRGTNSWSVHFGSLLTGATLTDVDGVGSVVWTPVGAAPVSPSLDGGNAVVYRDAWPNVDIRRTTASCVWETASGDGQLPFALSVLAFGTALDEVVESLPKDVHMVE